MFDRISTTIQSGSRKMSPFNPFRNPENIAHIFAQYVRSMVQLLIWATIGLASLAATYVGIRAILVAVRYVLDALGIPR